MKKFIRNIKYRWANFWKSFIIVNREQGDVALVYRPEQNHLTEVHCDLPKAVNSLPAHWMIALSILMGDTEADFAYQLRQSLETYFTQAVVRGLVPGLSYDLETLPEEAGASDAVEDLIEG